MIDIKQFNFTVPDSIDWDRTRTYWACPPLGTVDLNSDVPVTVRDNAEKVINDELERVIVAAHFAGDVEAMWMGEPVADMKDWMDCRRYYPIRAMYRSDPPAQATRPYRISPFLKTDNLDDPTIQFYAGLEMMRKGDFENGLPLYEYRWLTKQGLIQRPKLEYPLWDGKSEGKILIHVEQGAGDCFQFCRFLKHVKFDADFAVFSEIHELMKGANFPVNVILDYGIEEYDYHLPLCSLPIALGLNVTADYAPYLRANKSRVRTWLDHLPCGHKTGIVWAGNQTHQLNADRTIRLEDVIGHCRSDTQLVSVQVGAACEQLKYLPRSIKVLDCAKDLENWSDTAGLVSCLDEIVTIDSGVAHLCGAMGIPTKLLLTDKPEWRWSANNWYKSLSLTGNTRCAKSKPAELVSVPT